MRASGTLALLLFLAPTVYVVKYYASDKPREEQRARLVSLAPLPPSLPVDAIAPPLAPSADGNAAQWYVPAIQSYARRAFADGGAMGVPLPTPTEVAGLLEGGQRRTCAFFNADPLAKPRFVFRDPDTGRDSPYRYPLTAREPYRYLSYATRLALAMSLAPTPPGPGADAEQATVARAIIRFGEGLGREHATRTHLAVANAVQRIGLRMLLQHPTQALRRYVDAQQTGEDAVQAKYALLEPINPDNIALQTRVARADPAPLWRREGVWAVGETLRAPGFALRRPLEAVLARAALADIAGRDPDPSVRAAAGTTLGEAAQRGAVIRR